VGVPQEDQAVVAEDLLDLGALGLVGADHQDATADDLAVLERGGLAGGGGDAAGRGREAPSPRGRGGGRRAGAARAAGAVPLPTSEISSPSRAARTSSAWPRRPTWTRAIASIVS